jgi:hypothetical protein
MAIGKTTTITKIRENSLSFDVVRFQFQFTFCYASLKIESAHTKPGNKTNPQVL